jgi:hypothetical protein
MRLKLDSIPLLSIAFVIGASFAAPVIGAEQSCAPRGSTTPAGAQTQKAQEAIRQTESACRTPALGLEPDPSAKGNPSIFAVVSLIYGEGKKRGGDRLKPEAPPGMPTGRSLAVNGQLDLDASAAAPEGLISMDVTGPQVNLRAQPIPADGIIHLPAAQLRPGGEYKWVMRTKRQSYDGSFVIADAETAKRIADRVQTIPSLNVSPSAALLLEAAIYDDEGFYSARDRIVETLKSQK